MCEGLPLKRVPLAFDTNALQLIRECLLGTSDTNVPRAPLTDKAAVMGVWVFYTLFVLIAFGVEKIGNRRKITPS